MVLKASKAMLALKATLETLVFRVQMDCRVRQAKTEAMALKDYRAWPVTLAYRVQMVLKVTKEMSVILEQMVLKVIRETWVRMAKTGHKVSKEMLAKTESTAHRASKVTKVIPVLKALSQLVLRAQKAHRVFPVEHRDSKVTLAVMAVRALKAQRVHPLSR